MNKYGIQILLDGGQTLLFHMDQREAQQLVTDFQQNAFRLRDRLMIGGTDPVTGVVWGVKVANVVGLHTTLIAAQPVQQQPPNFAPNYGVGSVSGNYPR